MLKAWTYWQSLTARLVDDERGASLVEYALLVVLIAIVAIVAIRLAGQQVSSTFDNIQQNLSSV